VRALGIRPPPPTISIAWRLYREFCCGFNKHISALRVTQLHITIIEATTSAEFWYEGLLYAAEIEFSAPSLRAKTFSRMSLGFPDVDKSEQIDDPPPFASPVE
jgi:hypothetical protein